MKPCQFDLKRNDSIAIDDLCGHKDRRIDINGESTSQAVTTDGNITSVAFSWDCSFQYPSLFSSGAAKNIKDHKLLRDHKDVLPWQLLELPANAEGHGSHGTK